MILFHQRKPRHFNYKYIYSKDKEQMSDATSRISGENVEGRDSFQEMKGAFVRSTKYLRKRKENHSGNVSIMSYGIIILIIVLFIVWHYLATGTWIF